MRCAVVVAHPDDEILFAGQLILSRPHDDWLIFCLTSGGDNDRAARFATSCHILGASGHIFKVPDVGPVWRPEHYLMAQEYLTAHLVGFDEVYTHGSKGEYGHPHHIAIHDIVTHLQPDAWSFWHSAQTGVGHCVPGESGWSVLVAGPGKKDAFDRAYGLPMLRALEADHETMLTQLFTLESFTR